MPAVSVIIAVYNSELYLRQCLDSVLAQKLDDIEVLCVNDGSTDLSLQILEEYAAKDERVRIFTKENEGLGGASARNFGLERAAGKYISVLDSDDFFDPEMLEKAVSRAEETNADVVIFGGAEYDNQNGGIRRVSKILNDRVIPEKDVFSRLDCPDTIYQLTQGMAWNKLFRQSFLRKYNLRFQQIKYTDDAYFTFAHLALAERISIVRDTLCYYRVNSGRNQTSGIANYPDSAYVPYIALKRSLVQWGLYESVKRSFVNCAAVFIRYCYDMIDRYEALEYLHEKLRREIFAELDIIQQMDEFFYDPLLAQWVCQVRQHSVPQLLFLAARAHGSVGSTTGILRFQFPYDRIERNCALAIIGSGIQGRHHYSQVLLSGCCDVVLWVDWNNPLNYRSIQPMEALLETPFDMVLVAAEPDHLSHVLSWLREAGIPEKKIVMARQ